MSWLLLRGLAREQRHWGDFTQRLQAAFPNETVHCIDFAGNGAFHQMTSPVHVEAMVKHVRSEWQKIQTNLATPPRILALSLGAMVALEWAKTYPQEVASLVLMNTSLAGFHPFYWRLNPRHYPVLIWTLFAGSLAQRERLIFELTINSAQPANLLQAWLGYAHNAPVSRRNVLRQLLAASRCRLNEHAPACPLLLLNGAADRLVDPRCSLDLAQRWQVPLFTHPNAGHDLPVDAPEWVVEQLSKQYSPR